MAMQIALSSSGTPDEISTGAGGSCPALSRKTLTADVAKGARPVNASYSVAPTAYQSLASDADLLVRSSGAMYAGVPRSVPSHSLDGDVTSLVRPKSRITTRPSAVTSRFDGLMSRCSLPARWSVASPSTSCASVATSRGLGESAAASDVLDEVDAADELHRDEAVGSVRRAARRGRRDSDAPHRRAPGTRASGDRDPPRLLCAAS